MNTSHFIHGVESVTIERNVQEEGTPVLTFRLKTGDSEYVLQIFSAAKQVLELQGQIAREPVSASG